MDERIWHRSYDPKVPQSLDYRDILPYEFLTESARRFGSHSALTFLNLDLSFSEVNEQVEKLAAALCQLGLLPGDRVAILLPNLPQAVISFFAVMRAGGVAVMTNPLYMPPEIEHQWNDSECRIAIVADYLFDQKIPNIRSKLPVEQYIVTSIVDYLKFPIRQLARIKLGREKPPLAATVPKGPGVLDFRQLINSTKGVAPIPPSKIDDIAILQYTGGTTGVSKGTELTHRNLSYNTQQMRAWFTGIEEGHEAILGALPFFHIFGITVVMCLGYYSGASLALVANPRDLASVVKAVVKRKVTLLPAVPKMFQSICDYPKIKRTDLQSIKYCFSGSAPLPAAVQERFERMTGSIIVEGFGLTETSPVLTVNPLEGVRKTGSIGIPVSDTDVRIVDPEDGTVELPVGEPGEIIARGPQIMAGYWKQPGETSEMIRDGWIHTGDLGEMDEDGYFKVVGRIKDMILASGFNIYPDEIDDVITHHPAVLESCTIGIPDEKRGETVKTFVVLERGEKLTEEELVDHCRERMAAYKVPREFEFRPSLPRSTILKLLRRVLRDEELDKRKGQ